MPKPAQPQPMLSGATKSASTTGKLHHVLAILVVVLLASWCAPPGVPKHITGNLNVVEGYAWWAGRLDIASRIHDYAYYKGKLYNVFPPLVSILAALAYPIFPQGIPGWTIPVGIVLPTIVLGYAVFFRVTRSVPWATCLNILWLFGTPLFPILLHTGSSVPVYHVNHALSQIGILLILFEYSGKRRTGLMCTGLIIGAWSRQLTIAYALPILWAAWRKQRAARRRALVTFAATLVVCTAVPMTLNTLKFDHPLESGYQYIFADVSGHPVGVGPWHGLFSYRYIPQNFYYMNLRPPPLGFDEAGRLAYRGDFRGAAIWLTTPVLLFFWIDIRRHWKSLDSRVLLISMIPIVMALLMYFNTGASQKGYHRFTLDFLAPLLVLSAPNLFGPRRRWITLPLILVSVVYFRWLMGFMIDTPAMWRSLFTH